MDRRPPNPGLLRPHPTTVRSYGPHHPTAGYDFPTPAATRFYGVQPVFPTTHHSSAANTRAGRRTQPKTNGMASEPPRVGETSPSATVSTHSPPVVGPARFKPEDWIYKGGGPEPVWIGGKPYLFIGNTKLQRAKIEQEAAAAAVNKVTIRSPATSTKAVAVNNVSAKIAKLAKPVPVFVCDICTDSTALEESFSLKVCHHKYCKDCVNKYITSRLGENIAHISCPAPDCKRELEPDHCRSILPQETFVMWCDKLCEATVTVEGFAKLYCPYKDCSGLLIDDGTQMIKESECPHCRRLFCAQCKVPWHSEINCERFQKLHKHERQREDIMLMNLAETKLWKRCPNCKMYVERTDGCRYIKCRCGAAFCYGCGTLNIDLTTHYCYQCRA